VMELMRMTTALMQVRPVMELMRMTTALMQVRPVMELMTMTIALMQRVLVTSPWPLQTA
jgi:hypothetical protein